MPYDFRRPTALPREHVRRLEIAFDTFCRQLATQLTTRLRTAVHATATGVHQQTYDEYVAGLPTPTTLLTFSSTGLGGTGLLQLAPATALTWVDRLLGGPGGPDQPARPLTEIETVLVTAVAERALTALAYAFEPILPLGAEISGVHHDPQFVQALGASDMVLTAALTIAVAGAEQHASVTMPLDPVAARLQPASQLRARSAEQERAAQAAVQALTSALDDVPVQVSAALAPVRLRPSALLALSVGDVLRLPHLTDRPLELVSNGVTVAHGVAARRGGRLACLVVDPQEDPR